MVNPKGYYTSRYSGEEIDNLLSGIPPGGAADKSVQGTVGATSVPTSTVEVEAADLPAYITGLPRLLTKDLTVIVHGGSVLTALLVFNFYGSGSLTIKAAENEEVIVTNYLFVENCSIPVNLNRLKIKQNMDIYTLFRFNKTDKATVENCEISRYDGQISIGATVNGPGSVLFKECDIKHSNIALYSSRGGIVVVHDCPCSNNVIGQNVVDGGIIILSGNTPSLMGGNAIIKNGGFIVKADGTLL